MTAELDTVRVVAIVDTDPDMSWLGEYTDTPSPWAIVRAEGEYLADLGEDYDLPARGREYRFFVPYAGGETPGSADYKTYGMQDYGRCEDYNRGGWCFVGIRAEVDA